MWKQFVDLSHSLLWKDKEALSYLRARQVSDDSIKKFKLGRAPKIDDLLKVLSSEWLHQNGVIFFDKGTEKTTYKFQWYPIIFPIFNAHQECMGVAARATTKNIKPKYMNNRGLRIRDSLYGLNCAFNSIRRDGAIAVEGYMDVISAHQRGATNVVGTCGATLLKDQMNILRRYTKNIFRIIDNDDTGFLSHQRWKKKKVLSGIELKDYVFKYNSSKDLDEYFVQMGGSPEELFSHGLQEVDAISDSVRAGISLKSIID